MFSNPLVCPILRELQQWARHRKNGCPQVSVRVSILFSVGCYDDPFKKGWHLATPVTKLQEK